MRILFAGGGTGGHLYPGIALAQRLARQVPRSASLFLCTERAFDRRELVEYGFEHAAIPAPRLQSGWALPGRFLRAVARARRWIRSFRPNLVVGLGGYGSAPSLAAAAMDGVPIAVLEQNVRPGKANRAASRIAHRVYAQWEESHRHFPGLNGRFLASGSPLREDFHVPLREEALRRLGLEGGGPVVGVLGGSQGAESLNRLAARELPRLRGIRVVHLAGAAAARVLQEYDAAGMRARVEEYRRDMGSFYGACDVVVSRAGALALAELAAAGVPSVLVPYPRAAGDHQAENARVLERAGAAAVLDERSAAPGALAAAVGNLVRAPGECDRMRLALSPYARPDASRRILEDWIAWLPTRRRVFRRRNFPPPGPSTWSGSAASA